MSKREVSLDYLDKQLSEAAKLLDECAVLIRDLDLNRKENIRRIGETLARIFEIQLQIYAGRPDLMPDYLRKPPPSGDQVPRKRR